MLRVMRFSITAPIDTNHMWPLMLPLISRLCLCLLFLGSQCSNLLKLYRLKSLILNSMMGFGLFHYCMSLSNSVQHMKNSEPEDEQGCVNSVHHT